MAAISKIPTAVKSLKRNFTVKPTHFLVGKAAVAEEETGYLITGLKPNKIGLSDAVQRKSCCWLVLNKNNRFRGWTNSEVSVTI
jgi:hypothetical protein